METDKHPAFEKLRECVGAANLLTDDASLALYRTDVSGTTREVPAVVLPNSTEQVQQIVRIANDYLLKLYPVSCGKNWGMGSRLPVSDDAIVVDLSRMRKIHEVNVEQHYAVVDPGVTQGQLYDHLQSKGLPLVLNVTGSTRETSLIGNALERGVGYFASRADSLSGLEVVLGTGEVIHTGCGHFEPSVTTHINKHGLGPSLDGLFAQSNYGIVTRAGITLMPKRDATACMICKLSREEDLPELIDCLADLRRKDLIQTAVHIAHNDRSKISVCPVLFRYLVDRTGMDEYAAREKALEWFEDEGFGAWSAVGGLMGTPRQLAESKRHIKKAVKGLGQVIFITDSLVSIAKSVLGKLRFIPAMQRKEALLYSSEPFYELSKGVPTDAALDSAYWPITNRPGMDGWDPASEERCGLMYCLPMIPMDGKLAKEVFDLARMVCEKHELIPYVTLNMVTTKALECVINVAFDRASTEDVRLGREAIEEMHDEYLRRGYIPYRMSIHNMDLVVSEEDRFWHVVKDLKGVFDPNGVIAPGRYNLI